MKTVDTNELQEMKNENKDLVLVNTLEPEQFEAKHIPGSISAYVKDMDFVDKVREQTTSELTPIAVYCANEDCGLSTTGVERLETAGFENVFEYPGGIEAWAEAGLELDGEAVENRNDEEASENQNQEEKESDVKSDDNSKEENGPAPAQEDTSGTEDRDNQKEDKQKESTESVRENEIERSSTARWTGSLKDGMGRMTLGTSNGIELPYSFASRFGKEDASNPEELLGAALAGCFSMALTKILGESGYTPQKLETEVTLAGSDDSGDGFSITSASIALKVEVDRLENEKLQELSEMALKGCPISKALPDIPKELTIHFD